MNKVIISLSIFPIGPKHPPEHRKRDLPQNIDSGIDSVFVCDVSRNISQNNSTNTLSVLFLFCELLF